jgi:hypothetical protein
MTIGRQGEKEMFRDSTQGLTANSNIDLSLGKIEISIAPWFCRFGPVSGTCRLIRATCVLGGQPLNPQISCCVSVAFSDRGSG